MKITAELVRVRQDWDPNTNTDHNSVIFAFAGVQVEVPVTEAQVRAIIIESQRQKKLADRPGGELTGNYEATVQPFGVSAEEPVDEDAGGEELDDALASELVDEDEERVFGGDFSDPEVPVRHAPALFQGDETPEASLDAALAETRAPAPPPTPTQQRKAAVATNRAADPATQRAMAKSQMRARAAAVPQRKVAKDDMGNPVVYEARGAQIAGPAGHPEVVVRRQAPKITDGDDDGFGQG
jgi:hypothetical protein